MCLCVCLPYVPAWYERTSWIISTNWLLDVACVCVSDSSFSGTTGCFYIIYIYIEPPGDGGACGALGGWWDGKTSMHTFCWARMDFEQFLIPVILRCSGRVRGGLHGFLPRSLRWKREKWWWLCERQDVSKNSLAPTAVLCFACLNFVHQLACLLHILQGLHVVNQESLAWDWCWGYGCCRVV